MTRVQVLTTYPEADASRRLRIDPLVADLRRRGWRVDVDTVLSPWAFRHKNDGGVWRLGVAVALAWGLVRRLVVLARLRPGEVAVVHREAFPFFTPLVEGRLARALGGYVLDVDDALFAAPTHVPDWRRWLRDASKYDGVLRSASLVLAGNPQLVEMCQALGTPAVLSPTLPPESPRRAAKQLADRPLVLWTGSYSTLGSLQQVLDPVLAACAASKATLVVLGARNVRELEAHPNLVCELWTAEREEELLRAAWVGLMPLPDTTWERGKSAYKLMLYMHSATASVVSPIGMNADLIAADSGVTGAVGDGEWASAVERLCSDRDRALAAGAQSRAWIRQHLDAELQQARVTSAVEGVGREQGGGGGRRGPRGA